MSEEDTTILYKRTGPCIHGFYRAHRHGDPARGWNIACEGGRYTLVEPDYEAAWQAYNKRLDLDGVPKTDDLELLTPNAVNELGVQEAVNAAYGVKKTR